MTDKEIDAAAHAYIAAGANVRAIGASAWVKAFPDQYVAIRERIKLALEAAAAARDAAEKPRDF